jgi:transposase-like protein
MPCRAVDSRMVKNKAVYVALGVSRDGVREVLGLWIADNEGAKFWLSVMTELKNRGLQDILIAVVDGLKGFPPSHRNCVSTAGQWMPSQQPFRTRPCKRALFISCAIR